jgi:crossover junction endodeoxyribonuclease RuvC
MIILATDSGLEKTGYALFTGKERDFSLIDCGLIVTKRQHLLEKRLMAIYNQLEMIIKKHSPNLILLEKLFFNTNQKTQVTIAQTQGVLLFLAARYNIKVEFLTPLMIKQTVTGYGRADKLQVRKMVKLLLHKEKLPKSDDVIDAIACGIAYCNIKNYDR